MIHPAPWRSTTACHPQCRPMRERISSSWTFFYKTLFPLMWIITWVAVALGMWSDRDGSPPVHAAEILLHLLIFGVGGTTFIRWFARRLHTVEIRGSHLYADDGRRSLTIPLYLIDEVGETRFWNPKMIKLRFADAVEEKRTVVFLAPFAVQIPFTDHPVVRRLRARIASDLSVRSRAEDSVGTR
jgi:hypothetical protein